MADEQQPPAETPAAQRSTPQAPEQLTQPGSQTRGATPGQAPGEPVTPAETPNVLTQAETPPAAGGQPGGGDGDGEGGLTAGEEADLIRLQAKAARGSARSPLVRLKVEKPHASMRYGGVTLTGEYAPVPAALVPALETAAADAGVKLTRQDQDQEEGEG